MDDEPDQRTAARSTADAAVALRLDRQNASQVAAGTAAEASCLEGLCRPAAFEG